MTRLSKVLRQKRKTRTMNLDLKVFTLRFQRLLFAFPRLVFSNVRVKHNCVHFSNISVDLDRLARRPHAHRWAEGDRLHRVGGALS